MTAEVAFHSLAIADLDAIYDYIAFDSPTNAINYVRRLRAQCERLGLFPERGRLRDDLPGDVRTIPFERNSLIAYRVTAQGVVILQILYGGREPWLAFSAFD